MVSIISILSIVISLLLCLTTKVKGDEGIMYSNFTQCNCRNISELSASIASEYKSIVRFATYHNHFARNVSYSISYFAHWGYTFCANVGNSTTAAIILYNFASDAVMIVLKSYLGNTFSEDQTFQDLNTLYESTLRMDFLHAFHKIIDKRDGCVKEVTILGHAIDAAMGLIIAEDLVKNIESFNYDVDPKITLFAYDSVKYISFDNCNTSITVFCDSLSSPSNERFRLIEIISPAKVTKFAVTNIGQALILYKAIDQLPFAPIKKLKSVLSANMPRIGIAWTLFSVAKAKYVYVQKVVSYIAAFAKRHHLSLPFTLTNWKLSDANETAANHLIYNEMLAFLYNIVDRNVNKKDFKDDYFGRKIFLEPLVESQFPNYEYLHTLRSDWKSSCMDISANNSFFGIVLWEKKDRELVFVFRGDLCLSEKFLVHYNPFWASWKDAIFVQKGYRNLYRGSMQNKSRRLLDDILQNDSASSLSIILTGHRLGAGLAVLAALDLAQYLEQKGGGLKDRVTIKIVSYACPSVGNRKMHEELDRLKVLNYHHHIASSADSPPGFGLIQKKDSVDFYEMVLDYLWDKLKRLFVNPKRATVEASQSHFNNEIQRIDSKSAWQRIALTVLSWAKTLTHFGSRNLPFVGVRLKLWDIDEAEARRHIEYGDMIAFADDILERNKRSQRYQDTVLWCDEAMDKVFSALFPGFSHWETLQAYKPTDWTDAVSSKSSFWGLAAFSEQRKELVVVFRGAKILEEWRVRMRIFPEEWAGASPQSKASENPLTKAYRAIFGTNKLAIYHGYHALFTEEEELEGKQFDKSLRATCKDLVNNLTAQYPNEPVKITVTGHSIGGALAVLSALYMAELLQRSGKGSNVSIQIVSFACPSVGTKEVGQKLKELKVKHIHYFNAFDIVPQTPESVTGRLNEVPRGLTVNHSVVKDFNILHPFQVFEIHHNLEVILFGLAQKAKVPRRISLMNKEAALVRDSASVADKWHSVGQRLFDLTPHGEMTETFPQRDCDATANFYYEYFCDEYVRIHDKICNASIAENNHLF